MDHNLLLDEATLFERYDLLIPKGWCLSPAGRVILPIPDDTKLTICKLQCRKRMTQTERSHPDNAENNYAVWFDQLRREREKALNRWDGMEKWVL